MGWSRGERKALTVSGEKRQTSFPYANFALKECRMVLLIYVPFFPSPSCFLEFLDLRDKSPQTKRLNLVSI